MRSAGASHGHPSAPKVEMSAPIRRVLHRCNNPPLCRRAAWRMRGTPSLIGGPRGTSQPELPNGSWLGLILEHCGIAVGANLLFASSAGPGKVVLFQYHGQALCSRGCECGESAAGAVRTGVSRCTDVVRGGINTINTYSGLIDAVRAARRREGRRSPAALWVLKPPWRGGRRRAKQLRCRDGGKWGYTTIVYNATYPMHGADTRDSRPGRGAGRGKCAAEPQMQQLSGTCGGRDAVLLLSSLRLRGLWTSKRRKHARFVQLALKAASQANAPPSGGVRWPRRAAQYRARVCSLQSRGLAAHTP
ncbi:hypothetical protein K505DRAFT_344422 [Melanomma pulvis-pyrius CBS 109.77]|uniref:Uncharacterized protein n=1 Tax=Melanomma pulvis-pyrius CBS 109.77 TaxID=1314802 RepID=A0A6A6WNR6_9PLEO|nr:hypothetical protein K505DRAFT_344422 [Melanomma pulvis-pyrius CBS 109.77]